MRVAGAVLAALLAFTASRAAGQEPSGTYPDIVTIIAMSVTDADSAPVERWRAEQPLKGTIRFAIGGREDQEVPVIVRVVLEEGPSSDAPWVDLFDGRLAPGEHSFTWDFVAPSLRRSRSARLVWSVKANYYVAGRLLSWALGNQSTQPLDFDGRTVREIRETPGLAESTRQGIWVRNRQADRSYEIVP